MTSFPSTYRCNIPGAGSLIVMSGNPRSSNKLPLTVTTSPAIMVPVTLLIVTEVFAITTKVVMADEPTIPVVPFVPA